MCGPDDIIAPIGNAEERRQQSLHYQGRPPQNWRVHGWWQSPRPLFKRYWFRFNPGDYGFYNHIPAKQARALLNDDKAWHSYFKFAFDRNPWDRQVSWYLYKTKSKRSRPSFESFMSSRRRACVYNYRLYTIEGALAVDFLGRYERLEEDLNKALERAGVRQRLAVPRTNITPNKDEARDYRSYYSPETRALVSEWYQPEIALLGYGF